MFGKASLLLVMGFSTIFMVYNANMLTTGNDSVDVFTSYYAKTNASFIAASGAHIACNNIYFTPNWNSGISNLSINGGTLNVVVTNLTSNRRQIQSISSFMGEKDTVTVVFQPSNFAKFAYYCSNMPGNLYYISGDTVWGPMHIQGKLNVSGSPVFYGKVTTKTGLKTLSSRDDPKFYGGYETGVDLTMPSDYAAAYSAASSGGRTFSNKDVWIEFNADGSLRYKEGASGSWVTTTVSAFAPNGVVYVDKGNLYIKGTLNGKLTLAAGVSSGTGSGNVYLEDDIVYADDPRDGSSDDMLGILASNDIVIRDNAANRSNINIHASIFSLRGGLEAENYNRLPYCGSINLFGGLIENQAQPTGVFDPRSGRITSGFNSNFRYDERFMIEIPPSFPVTGSYEIISWLE